jgi:hypothetical protein
LNLKGPLVFRNPASRFDLPGDKGVFDRIVSDMIEHGGRLAPSEHWNWNLGTAGENSAEKLSGYTEELFEEKYSRLDMMLNPWVGVTGMKPIDEDAVTKYEGFLRTVDHLGLLPGDTLVDGTANGWRETDLGSVMDANLISAHSPGTPASGRTAICEVGGGYGRLAEVMTGGSADSMHYVLVDAVPGSLMYAYSYLKAQLPDHKIGSFYNGDAYSTDFDCYVIPAWHTSVLADSCFDLCINIESMQEMEQHHVDFYIGLFDRLAVHGGEIYLSNARDYVFQGTWRLPDNWQTVFLSNTPRSWTADHPTHILYKREGDFSLPRSMHEAAFRQQIDAWKEAQRIGELERHIADRDRICGELQTKVEQLELAGKSPDSLDKAEIRTPASRMFDWIRRRRKSRGNR